MGSELRAGYDGRDGALGTAAADPRLQFLLNLLDPHASLPLRHICLIKLLAWVGGDGKSASAAVGRVRQFLQAIEARPAIEAHLREWWAVFVREVELTAMLADHGFSPRSAFLSEFGERLRRKLLPATPETIDASSLLRLALPVDSDAAWLQQLDADLLRRIARLAPPDLADGVPHWQSRVMDAVTFCASQVVAAGFSSELRLRMSDPVRAGQPFHELMVDLDRLRDEALRRPRDPEALKAAFKAFRERLEGCREAAASVYAHLEENGISVGLVFRLRQLRARMVRIRDLLDCLLSEQPHRAIAQMLARLVLASGERHSIRALIVNNASLLAAKVAERSAEVGEHYITRDRAEYRGMLHVGGGRRLHHRLHGAAQVRRVGDRAVGVLERLRGRPLVFGERHRDPARACDAGHQAAGDDGAGNRRQAEGPAHRGCYRGIPGRGHAPGALASCGRAGQRAGGGGADGAASLLPVVARAGRAAARRGACARDARIAALPFALELDGRLHRHGAIRQQPHRGVGGERLRAESDRFGDALRPAHPGHARRGPGAALGGLYADPSLRLRSEHLAGLHAGAGAGGGRLFRPATRSAARYALHRADRGRRSDPRAIGGGIVPALVERCRDSTPWPAQPGRQFLLRRQVGHPGPQRKPGGPGTPSRGHRRAPAQASRKLPAAAALRPKEHQCKCRVA